MCPEVQGWNFLEPGCRIICAAMASLPRIFFLGGASSFCAWPLRLREAIEGVAIEAASLWHGQSSDLRLTTG